MHKDDTRYVIKEEYVRDTICQQKGYIFCQNGLDLSVEPLRIELCRIPLVSLNPPGVILTYHMGLTKLECKSVKMCYKYVTNF